MSFFPLLLWLALAHGPQCDPNHPGLITRNQGPTPARVVFLDGSTITLQNPALVYLWKARSRMGYANTTGTETAVREFHYTALAHGVALRRAIPLDSVREIRFFYRTVTPPRSETTVVLERTILTTRSGVTHLIDREVFGPSGNQLPASLAGTPEDPALFESLSLRGETSLEGEHGTFTGLLLNSGPPASNLYLPRAERPNEACHACRGRDAIVQVVIF